MLSFVIVLCAFRFAVISNSADIQTIVETTYGPIEGELTPLIRQFLSIPYAAPSNTTRWQPPKANKGWTSTLQTKNVAPGCPQQCSSSIPTECPTTTNEDCLYLNIFTPLSFNYNSTNYPVIFYIHGGGFEKGHGYAINTNATFNVNRTETIYVTVNYRLGALGFLWDESIGISGNYGYLDQSLALEWIYKNIANFGGNPESIIINGQSAGCMSVDFHLSNTTNNIIKGAIMESCANNAGPPYYTPNIWGEQPLLFESAIGCNQTNDNDRLTCMMGVSADILVKQQSTVGIKWGPTVKSSDNLFSDQPIWLYQENKTLNVPFIIGNNKHELGQGCSNNNSVSYAQLNSHLTDLMGVNNANKVLEYYNVRDNSDNYVNISCQISTDYNVKCISRNMTASSSMNNLNNNYYFYQFNHASSFNNEVRSDDYCWSVPCHSAELWYSYYSPYAMKEILNITFEENESVLAMQFGDYWTNFANYPFNPNVKRNVNNESNIIEWKPYKNDDRQILLFDVGDQFEMVQDYDLQVCQFWDSLNWSWLKVD